MTADLAAPTALAHRATPAPAAAVTPAPAPAATPTLAPDAQPEPAQPPAQPPRAKPDPRIIALRRFAISITAFNVLGHLFLGFEQAYLTPVVGVLTAYLVSLLLETVDSWARGTRPRYLGSPVGFVNFLLPAHIAGLACAMLLYGNDSLWPTIFAAAVAVSGKYVVRVRINGAVRHVFNPSNLGITVTLLVFSWVSIAPPYHFSENVGSVLDWLIPAFILASGTMLNAKLTHRMPLIAGWVGGFVLQAVLRALFFDDALVSALLTVVGIAFVLFTNYMITDPGTTPSAPRYQVLFGLATALVYGALVVAHITFGLFFALTIVCAARLLWTLARQVRVR
jgi:Na+-translocating ferredoxin:NAD+ oxidoreductase RnfD subunit